MDAGVPPPVVVVTPPPEDSTTSPDSGQPLLADIELPAFIIGGDDGTGTVLLARRTDKPVTLTFSTSDRDVEVVPATVAVEAGVSRVGFRLRTHPPHADTPIQLTAKIGAESRTATFTLALPRPINRADAYTAIAGRTLVVSAPGILENDTRRQGHDLTAVVVTGPDHGTLTLSPSGGFTFAADSTYVGHDRFIYRAFDGVVGSGLAHVNITVIAPPAPPDTAGSRSFSFTGGSQSFTVPAGVSQITIDASGAQGSPGNGGGTPSSGGLGGNVVATIPVTPGETLTVLVGGQAGFNGGGSGGPRGGGSSDVWRGGTALVIAGGGGGAGRNLSFTGPDGGAGGGAGSAAGASGGGGTQTAGGGGGAGIGGGNNGASGSANSGGTGGSGLVATGGGGGGGFFGGGGGGGANGPNSSGGGGGGSSFVISGASGISHTQGARISDGLIVIRW